MFFFNCHPVVDFTKVVNVKSNVINERTIGECIMMSKLKKNILHV